MQVSISHHHSGLHAGRVPGAETLSSFRRFAGRLADAWRHHRDELELENLPFDVRKDIGFPATDVADIASVTRKTR